MNDFEKWLLENKDRFSTYTLAEIQDLAIACGFSRIDVAQWRTREMFRRAA